MRCMFNQAVATCPITYCAVTRCTKYRCACMSLQTSQLKRAICSRARCVNNLNALHRRACNRSNFQSVLVQLHSALATATATTIPLACPGCHNLYVGKTPMLVANLLPCTNKCLSQCQASVLQLMQTNVAVREHCTLPNRSICQRQRARKL